MQDAEKYRNEILSQLSNTRFYQKVNYDPTSSFHQKILSYLEDAKKRGWITESEFGFLFCKHPIRAVIYTLPKYTRHSRTLLATLLWRRQIPCGLHYQTMLISLLSLLFRLFRLTLKILRILLIKCHALLICKVTFFC